MGAQTEREPLTAKIIASNLTGLVEGARGLPRTGVTHTLRSNTVDARVFTSSGMSLGELATRHNGGATEEEKEEAAAVRILLGPLADILDLSPKDLLLQYSRRNSGLLPQDLVVYRKTRDKGKPLIVRAPTIVPGLIYELNAITYDGGYVEILQSFVFDPDKGI